MLNDSEYGTLIYYMHGQINPEDYNKPIAELNLRLT